MPDTKKLAPQLINLNSNIQSRPDWTGLSVGPDLSCCSSRACRSMGTSSTSSEDPCRAVATVVVVVDIISSSIRRNSYLLSRINALPFLVWFLRFSALSTLSRAFDGLPGRSPGLLCCRIGQHIQLFQSLSGELSSLNIQSGLKLLNV